MAKDSDLMQGAASELAQQLGEAIQRIERLEMEAQTFRSFDVDTIFSRLDKVEEDVVDLQIAISVLESRVE